MSIVNVKTNDEIIKKLGVGDIVKTHRSWAIIATISDGEKPNDSLALVSLTNGTWKSYTKDSMEELKEYIINQGCKFEHGVDWISSDRLYINMGVK